MTETAPKLAFLHEPNAAPDIEIRVNFGVFSGREVTLAETDALARALLGPLGRVSIVSLRRHELDRRHEAVAHQVKVEASLEDALGETTKDALAAELLDLVDAWARTCIGDRHVLDVGDPDALDELAESG